MDPHQDDMMTNAGGGKNTLMAILAYVGPFILVSYLTAKDDPFVKFHIKQGLVLVVIELIVWILIRMFWTLWPLQIVNLLVLVLSILGIINAAQGKEKALPVVGGYSEHFKF
jgi:uncharacterized membrane protein